MPVPVIASGGVGTLEHLADGIRIGGADAVLAASIFHYGEFTVARGQGAAGRATASRCGGERGPASRRHARARPREVRIIGGALEAQQAAGGRPAGPAADAATACARRCSTGSARTSTGWRCLDAFAGSGALGFEAASRGAAEVVLLERDPALVRQPGGDARQRLQRRRRCASSAPTRCRGWRAAPRATRSSWCCSIRRSMRRCCAPALAAAAPDRRARRLRLRRGAASARPSRRRPGSTPWRAVARRRRALPPVAPAAPAEQPATLRRDSAAQEASLTSVTRLTAVYPGTFDPMTLGHEDLMRRASRLFERLIVAVAAGHHKRTMFTIAERLEIASELVEHVPERRGDGVSRPAARLRRRARRQGRRARPARGQRLRVRVPDGRHEPAADARGRNRVHDAERPVPVRQRHLRARDCHPRRRCFQVRGTLGAAAPAGARHPQPRTLELRRAAAWP